MPHVETFDPELERAHRRMDDIERKLQRFNNPTPTIPEYDLGGVAPESTVLASVTMGVRINSGSPPDQVQYTLNADSGGPGAELAASDPVTPTISSSPSLTFTFPGGYTLVPGAIYWLVLQRTGSLDNANYYDALFNSISAGTATPPSTFPDGYYYYDTGWNFAGSSFTFIHPGTVTYMDGQTLWDGGQNGTSIPFGNISGFAKIASTFTL